MKNPSDTALQADAKSRVIVCASIVFIAAVACMWPAAKATFVSGDDERLILNHLLVNHPTPGHAWTVLTRLTDDLYQPIPMISFQLNYALAGADADGRFPVSARGFHATNLMLHGVCAVLVFFVVRRIAGCTRIGFVTATLFACHPFAVEPVAWINGRMILLATLFALLMIWLRIREGTPSTVVAVIAWAASVASKVVPTMPITAMWCEWRVRGRLVRRDWIAYGTMIAIAAGGTLLATKTTIDAAGEGDAGGASAFVRVAMAWRYYVENYFWPTRLCAWSPPSLGVSASDPRVMIAIAEASAFTIAMWFFRKRNPAAFFGIGFFAITILPFLAAGTTRRFLAADRYMYLPIVGLHCAVAAICVQTFDRLRKRLSFARADKVVGWPLAAAVLASFMWSHRLCDTWADSVRRDERVVAVNPTEPDAHAQLAKAYLFQRDPDAALRVISSARATLVENGRLAAAAGEAYRQKRDFESAERELRVAVEKLPEHTRTNFLFALTLEDRGRYAEATARYQKLVATSPEFLPALTALARCHRRDGRVQEATTLYERALKINENNVESLRGLAGILMESKQDDRALKLLQHAARFDMSDITAMTWLHTLLVEHGRGTEAAAIWDRVLTVSGRSDEVLAWRAWGELHAGRSPRPFVEQVARARPERNFAEWAVVVEALGRGDEDAVKRFDLAVPVGADVGSNRTEKRRLIVSAIGTMPGKVLTTPAAMYLVARAFVIDGQVESAKKAATVVLQSADPFWRDLALRLMRTASTTEQSEPH
ncbi:MAG: tetratricopeptide repeat protein [Planctomycetes bacterium]|nr:tetratricopeptide repeat protein [Planctomycetota bacterium]